MRHGEGGRESDWSEREGTTEGAVAGHSSTMENSSYLHKKFKKQLSVAEPPLQHEAARPEKADNNPPPVVPNSTNNANQTEPSSISASISATDPEPVTSSILENNHQDKDNPAPDRGKYVCSYCSLVCSKPSVLQKHIRAHTNERPFPCNSCGFSFKTRSNLYKHCRSRTHANRVMGNKAQEEHELEEEKEKTPEGDQYLKNKPYKPRFHTKQLFKENEENTDDERHSNLLSDHINNIINKNNSIVNSNDHLLKKRADSITDLIYLNNIDEPLNLTKNQNRKRSLSEVVEPVAQKSLIKELLLKNLNSDMQCPHCKMIFQTVTELELHKLRSCKGFVKPGAKYTRSSSVNVASILTQNKNAFDGMPLRSPGPFLGKTRLVESDKSKSFSFDDGLPSVFHSKDRFRLSPLTLPSEKEKKAVKLFGGEVKIQTPGEAKGFAEKEGKYEGQVEFSGKVSENRVVKSSLSLQSGGTVLTNKPNYPKQDRAGGDVIRVYENSPVSPSIDIASLGKSFSYARSDLNRNEVRPHLEYTVSSSSKYTNIVDFSQKAVKLLTPNLKQPNLAVPGVPMPQKFVFPSVEIKEPKIVTPVNICNPYKLLVDGKVVRYVPGMPGPVAAEEPVAVRPKAVPPTPNSDASENKVAKTEALKVPEKQEPLKKFARPNSLALKPTSASLKQHHGLTPTMFNQILISPETPRVAKKYVQQFLHGNYFSYLGLKCSTKPVYCTLNKTQPFYVPHFKKLSMYSEWRQQDTKTEKLFVSGYDSRQRPRRYTTAGRNVSDLVVHSSYKFVVSESSGNPEKSDEQKANTILGGYECNEDYTYVRGRGRGRYVCDQCGIRCKKPSMLKKHIRTHSNDRPYTCNHCNFSFKTKGNLTKHMKSKAHTKNYAASGSGSSTQQSGTQSSESDTDDSGMDSSDESTRREEHEAAYGLLSLAQKHSRHPRSPSDVSQAVLNTEEITHASQATYARNKILDETLGAFSAPKVALEPSNMVDDDRNVSRFLGKTTANRPLTYPYTSVLESPTVNLEEKPEKNIKQFHVIQKYASDSVTNYREKVTKSDRTKVLIQSDVKVQPPVLKVNDAVVSDDHVTDLRKRRVSFEDDMELKKPKADEVMDLSMPTEKHQRFNGVHEECSVIKKVEPARGESPIKNGYVVAPTTNEAVGYIHVEGQPSDAESPKYKSVEYDNSAMETLADIATKQVKLEKNTLAKSVASEFLKIATKNESPDAARVNQEVNDLIVRPEGNKSCHICAKSFTKAPQLRLHMNIHYLERPFRCHSCSVSFRTKGHLQKHERSASHHNKLSSSPALSSSEPRPFKCVDCNIAFRIHGHLAKHLRSKMHIMKLECLAKIPFGLYAELERSNSLLTEINTADGDQCLESLKTLARKVFINDPSKLNQLTSVEAVDAMDG